MTARQRNNIWTAAIIALLALALALGTLGCTTRQQTVVPPSIVSTQASADGNVFNSGAIGPDGRGGFFVTQHFIDRWDALLLKYGGRLTPALKSGDRRGISAIAFDKYSMTAETMSKFRTMNLRRKADQGP